MVCFAPLPFPVYLCANVGPRGATHHSACPLSTTLSPALWIYLCANVGPQGLLVVRLPARFVPHSASMGPAMATQVLSALVLVSAPPTGLDLCFFFIYLVWDFLAFLFSVSSGCARRCSVSTYAAILVLPYIRLLTRIPPPPRIGAKCIIILMHFCIYNSLLYIVYLL